MYENQRKVIEQCINELIEDLEFAIHPFSTHLMKHGVMSKGEIEGINEPTSQGKLRALLSLVQTKVNGWEAITSYLEKNNFVVAETLKDLLEELRNSSNSVAATAIFRPTESKTLPEKDFIEEFTVTLAGFYVSQYSKVRTMFGCNRDVNEIWVPLRFEEKTKNPKQKDNFNHFELLDRLADKESYSVALVKGHPGMGKTTLVQKIAYDWATNKVDQFELILTVPLRYVGKTSDFLDLAADYYTNHLHVLPGCKDKLLWWLKSLGKKLLICFDGLDEYGHLADSPFKTMFQGLRATNKPCPIPLIPYKLLITSRPYACGFINLDFSPIKFEISPVKKRYLARFVQLYCETYEGKTKVTKYLKEHSDLVIKVPLILTFVCYLADLREEIPTNLTFLYDKLLGHMVKREVEGNKLTEKFVSEKWQESAVVKWTAQLAFEGCLTDELEFHPSLELDAAKDSFACGFLLHTFNFYEETLNAEFPHRSIQEFFAALHCYHLNSTTNKAVRNSIMKEIINNEDSQFGRFFFGLCSTERNKFEEVLDWLNPTFGDVEIFSDDLIYILERLSDCLSDCSEAELLGERLAASLDQFENQIQNEREEMKLEFRWLDLPLSNRTFQSGLNLNGTWDCWSISHVDKPRWSRLTDVLGDLQVDLREEFDKIQILLFRCYIHKLAEQISSVDHLPEVSILIISTGNDLEVNFRLEYGMTTTKNPTAATAQLRHFCFQFGENRTEVLKENFKDQLQIDGLVIGESHKIAHNNWVAVTVNKIFDRSHLIRMLVRLALEIVSRSPRLRSKSQPTVAQEPSVDQEIDINSSTRRITRST